LSKGLAVLTNFAEDLQDKVEDGTLSGAAAYQVSQLDDEALNASSRENST